MTNTLQLLIVVLMLSCWGKPNQARVESELQSIPLTRGEIALCGSGNGEFGTVKFNLACSKEASVNFNLATALLHSFEYTEAEKVFAKVADDDPGCVMAYWGLAMCSFHSLWAPPGQADLEKGVRIIALGRSLVTDKASRESDYLEAIATIFDQWDKRDYTARLKLFELASEKLYLKYPDDDEAAIFYALALRSAANPTDKTFRNQKKAGGILNTILTKEPNHPGIAHYIIHTYDYPELAELALPAARKYASIASASAHALHMPSHIFTRLGLWDEAIQSNLNSVAAAKCYAQNLGIKGHWDEELHGMDYLLYSYLQEAKDDLAKEQIVYLHTIQDVFLQDFKDAYSFAAMPARYALERKQWKEASQLELKPVSFPWNRFQWEEANLHFARLLGQVHTGELQAARNEMKQLQTIHQKLTDAKQMYQANLVMIQIIASEGWIEFGQGRKAAAIELMEASADMEDQTEKHPVTPGEIIPARELLGDMLLEMGETAKAREAYSANLKRHPNRFNGIYGAARAEEKSGNPKNAAQYYKQLIALADASGNYRPELVLARSFLKYNP